VKVNYSLPISMLELPLVTR